MAYNSKIDQPTSGDRTRGQSINDGDLGAKQSIHEISTAVTGGLRVTATVEIEKPLSPEIKRELLGKLQDRFNKNKQRHERIQWESVLAKLEAHPDKERKFRTLYEMEIKRFEPDVIDFDVISGEYLFFTCYSIPPFKNIVYDKKAADWVINNGQRAVSGNAVEIALTIGMEMLEFDEYRRFQKIQAFDEDTKTWLKTPEYILNKDPRRANVGWRFGATTLVDAEWPGESNLDLGLRGVLRI